VTPCRQASSQNVKRLTSLAVPSSRILKMVLVSARTARGPSVPMTGRLVVLPVMVEILRDRDES